MHFTTYLQALLPLMASGVFAAPNINDSNFQKAVLNAHNSDRAKHSTGALVWDNTLASYAQSWANNCAFKHSGGKYGENLYGISTSSSSIDFIKQTTSGITDAWYAEGKNYNYNNPGFSEATGHFTQVVWKSSKKVGCAWNTVSCKNNGLNFFKFVCEYDPPGNVVGGNNFKNNVLPPTS